MIMFPAACRLTSFPLAEQVMHSFANKLLKKFARKMTEKCLFSARHLPSQYLCCNIKHKTWNLCNDFLRQRYQPYRITKIIKSLRHKLLQNVEKITINKLNKQENKRKTRIMQNFIKENKKGRWKTERKWNCIKSECESERTKGKIRIYK